MIGTSTAGMLVIDGEAVERRAHVRWPFRGTAFPVRMGKKELEIRLKDLSRGGVCGLMDEPLAIGDYVFIQFEERHVAEAQVRWVRRVMVGLKFSTILPASLITRLHDRASQATTPDDRSYRRS